jgi:hypothetical protein
LNKKLNCAKNANNIYFETFFLSQIYIKKKVEWKKKEWGQTKPSKKLIKPIERTITSILSRSSLMLGGVVCYQVKSVTVKLRLANLSATKLPSLYTWETITWIFLTLRIQFNHLFFNCQRIIEEFLKVQTSSLESLFIHNCLQFLSIAQSIARIHNLKYIYFETFFFAKITHFKREYNYILS